MVLVEAFARAHRAALQAFNEGDYDTAFAGAAKDVEWDLLPALPDAERLRGRDAVIAYFRSFAETVHWEVEARQFWEVGPRLMIIHEHGRITGRTTSLVSEVDFFHLWEVNENGRAVRVREFGTRRKAFEAAGVPEPT